MSFGFEGFGKKKELSPIDSVTFKELYDAISESAFSENVRSVASDLKERMTNSSVDEERYVDTLQAIQRFLKQEGYKTDDLNSIEILVSELMKNEVDEESLQAYLANSPLKGVDRVNL